MPGLAHEPERRPAPGARPSTAPATPTAPRQPNRPTSSASICPSRSGPASSRSNARYATPGWSAATWRRVADVGLAHLDEPAARRQQPQRRVDELPGQRSSAPHPHPARRSRRGTPARNPASRDEAMWPSSRPSGGQHIPLAGTGGREHLRAQVPGDLHRGHADPAGRRVDQHRLPGPQPGQVHQRVLRGRERHRHRRRLANDQPAGIGASSRAIGHRHRPERARHRSPSPRRPPPGPSRPARSRSPPRRPSLPRPRPWPGSMPSATSTSRKFTPAARTATRTCPASSGAARLAGLASARPSSVPRSADLQPPVPPRLAAPARPAARPGPAAAPAPAPPRTASSRLTIPGRRGDQRQHPLIQPGIGIGQHQPPGMLRLRRRDQAPHRRPGQIGHGLTRPAPPPRHGSPPPAANRRTGHRPATPAPGPARHPPRLRTAAGTRLITGSGQAATTTAGTSRRPARPPSPKTTTPGPAPPAHRSHLMGLPVHCEQPLLSATGSGQGGVAGRADGQAIPPRRPASRPHRPAAPRSRRRPGPAAPAPGRTRRVQRHPGPRERQHRPLAAGAGKRAQPVRVQGRVSSAGCSPKLSAGTASGSATSANTSSPRRHAASRPRNAGP